MTYVYTYNPYEFCEDDYTEVELQTLFRDIANGECKKEPKTIVIITPQEMLQKGLIDQNAHFIGTNTKIECCLPVEIFFIPKKPRKRLLSIQNMRVIFEKRYRQEEV